MPRPKPTGRNLKFKPTPLQVEYMLLGRHPKPMPLEIQYGLWGGMKRTGEPSYEEMWREFGDELLWEFVHARHYYGLRPRCWWRFSAPEPHRLQLNKSGIHAWTDPKKTGIDRELTFYGVPLIWTDPGEPAPIFESQAAYLRRHQLFLEDEEKFLGPEDFEPEVFDGELNLSDLDYRHTVGFA
jgi:hypothetical protein